MNREQPTAGPAQWLMLGAFGVYCFVYPFAILLMSLDLMPFGMEWMSSLLLAMLGITAGAWLAVNFGVRGALLAAAIFLLGLALEYVGVATGVPFGSYRYTGVLVPELPGGVPPAIGFAWLLIVVGGLFSAVRTLPAKWGKRQAASAISLVGAVLALGLDLLLEPVAYHVKHYWEWAAGQGGYYGVPWSNFAAWLVAALAMNLLVTLLVGAGQPARWRWVPMVLYAMNVVMFGIVNLAHGFWLAGPVGLALLAAVWAARQRALAG